MRVDANTLPGAHSQAGREPGPRKHLITISGTDEELEYPRALIDKARRILLSAKPEAKSQNRVARKAIGVLYAASLRAEAIGRWDTNPAYDPLADYIEIKALAASYLGPIVRQDHPISQLRLGIDMAVSILSGART